VAKKALEKILVILAALHIFVESTESVPPSLKLVFHIYRLRIISDSKIFSTNMAVKIPQNFIVGI